MPAPDGLSSPANTVTWQPVYSGTRLMRASAAALRFSDGKLPDGVLTFHVGDRDPVVICCPFTGVPLTVKMARASGVSNQQLQAMVSRTAPLGAKSVAQWQRLERELVNRLQRARTDEGWPLSPGSIRVVAGGSAVGGFHSLTTTMQRGTFPANEVELEARVRNSPLHRDASPRELSGIVASAKLRYRALELGDRVPVAPWFNILNYLHIEAPSDADIRIVSSVVDDVMTERSQHDPSINRWTQADRLYRWNRDDVNELIPEIQKLSEDLQAYADVSLSFLSPKSGRHIEEQRDWWWICDKP